MKKHIWKWVLLLVAVVTGGNVFAQVTDEDKLQNAISEGGTVTLGADIELSSTLEISKDVVLDLNGKTIKYNQPETSYGNSVDAICIKIVEGSVVIKNGILHAVGGRYRTGLGWFAGNNAKTLLQSGGKLQIYELSIIADKGKGTSSLSDGEAYTLTTSNNLASVISYGIYITGISDYNLKEIKASNTEIKLSKYNAHFDLAGGQGNFPDISNYTLDNEVYKAPEGKPTRDGYSFEGWALQDGAVTVNDIPVLTNREPQGVVTMTAQWKPIEYKINYVGATDEEISQLPQTYTIEDKGKLTPYNLKLNDREDYRFICWLDENMQPITEEIDVKELKDRTLTAKWERTYKITYVYDASMFEPTDISSTKYTRAELQAGGKLPVLKGKDGCEFKGWYKTSVVYGDPVTDLKQLQDITENIVLYGLYLSNNLIELYWNGTDTPDLQLNYVPNQPKALPTEIGKVGYEVEGWYEDSQFTKPVSSPVTLSGGKKSFYAKLKLVEYNISYKYVDYEGVKFDKELKTYNYEQKVVLPNVTRPNYTFVGWHFGDQTTWGNEEPVREWEAGQQYGDKTLYAEWKGGMSVVFKQSEGGEITVKQGDKVLTSGTVVDPDTELTLSAKAKSGFQFKYFLVNGEENSSNPAKVKMPTENGLNIYAVFEDGRPAAAAPSVSLSPDNVSSFPVGAEVKVTLSGGESGAKLYYSLNGAENPYNGPFMVSSAEDKVIEVRGISRKDGYKDGVSEPKLITFGKGQISITFDLPEGITAVNPDGGEVETAVATGGSFKFKLVVDSKIIETPATAIKVYANGRQLSRGTGNTYVLSELKENVTVTVGNVEYKSFAIKLKQTDGGRIAFVGIAGDSCSVVYGDTIQLEAFPNAGYFFTAWNDNTKQNPRELIVKKAQTVSATFSKEKMVYMVTFPQIEGVTVKTLSGYSQQVDKNGTCKFWLDIDAQYKSSEPVVKVNGEVIEPTETGVYSLYYIREHKSVSVEGITRDKITLSQKTNTSITNVETGKDATKEGLYAGDMVTLYAKAPAGKMFSKWNDGVTENPRMMTASDAQGVQPLFISASGETESLSFTLPAGAGVVSLSGNLNAVEKGGSARFKIVLLPQYAGSKIVVKAAEKVLQQEMELRASTEAETYVYSLNNISENTTVTVEGLTLGSYTLTLEQTENGKVEADKTGEQLYGTVVNLTATPEAEYMFLRWSDGNTLNPYPYTITKNVTLKAEFLEADKMVVDNEEIAAQDARIYTANGSLYVELSQPSDLKVWNFSGAMLINRDIAPGLSSYPLPAGDYLVRVGNNKVVKVMVK